MAIRAPSGRLDSSVLNSLIGSAVLTVDVTEAAVDIGTRVGTKPGRHCRGRLTGPRTRFYHVWKSGGALPAAGGRMALGSKRAPIQTWTR